MRRLLAAIALPAAAFAQDSWVQSSAALALKLSFTGEQSTAPGKNASTIYSAPLETLRLGNREILEDMLADDELPGDSIAGWRIVAIWANWPDANPHAGNGYRFYARRGRGAATQTVPVSPHYLSIKPLLPAIGYRNAVSGETIVAGAEKFTVYVQTNFAIRGNAGVLTGIETGTGRYVRPAGSESTYYLPGAGKAVLQGTYEVSGEEGVGVASGTLSFGASGRVPASDYTGSGGSTSTGGTLVIGGSASATLDLAGFNLANFLLNGATLSGPFSLPGGTFSFGTAFSGTLTLNTGITLVFSPLPASTESLTGTLAFTKAGTLTLGTGETLPLLAGDTLALNTLSLAQLSPLTWAPAP